MKNDLTYQNNHQNNKQPFFPLKNQEIAINNYSYGNFFPLVVRSVDVLIGLVKWSFDTILTKKHHLW